MTVTGVLIALVVVAAVFAVMALRRMGDPASTAVHVAAPTARTGDATMAVLEATPVPSEADAGAPAAPSADVTAAEPDAEIAVQWPLRVAPRSAPLDEEARARLLGDLALLRAPWCVPILAEAYAEEPSAALRRAALNALGTLSASDEARRVLAAAADSEDEDERAIAAASLAEAQPAVESSPTIR
jgi:hypothetical protein